MNYEQLKAKYPLLNWKEAEEASQDELDAAVEYFNRYYNDEQRNKRTIN